MSNHLISETYKRQLGSMARNAVMVLLADKASDDGTGIWASKQRMAEELGTTKQTVITTIKGLIADKLLRESGKKKCPNGYTIEYAINIDALCALPLVNSHQSSDATGKAARPVKQRNPTGKAARPKPSRTKVSSNEETKRRAKHVAKPSGVSEAVWRDFTDQRKKGVTDTALRGLKREADKAGWTLEAALEEATMRGWEGFKADWVKEKKNGRATSGIDEICNPIAREVARRQAERAGAEFG